MSKKIKKWVSLVVVREQIKIHKEFLVLEIIKFLLHSIKILKKIKVLLFILNIKIKKKIKPLDQVIMIQKILLIRINYIIKVKQFQSLTYNKIKLIKLDLVIILMKKYLLVKLKEVLWQKNKDKNKSEMIVLDLVPTNNLKLLAKKVLKVNFSKSIPMILQKKNRKQNQVLVNMKLILKVWNQMHLLLDLVQNKKINH